MTVPSLTLARRLYARKYKLRVASVGASLHTMVAGGWYAMAFARPPAAPLDASCGARHSPTESAALRKLCRALGWKP
jgi:hypothetical protein